jgi:hypothetical protein
VNKTRALVLVRDGRRIVRINLSPAPSGPRTDRQRDRAQPSLARALLVARCRLQPDALLTWACFRRANLSKRYIDSKERDIAMPHWFPR